VVEIFRETTKIAPNAWLLLAGAGTDDPHGETGRAIRELGIGDRLLALGVRDDIPQLLEAADVLLLPSYFEGLPGVVLEACAAGVPVLASDIPGVREIASRLPLVKYLPLSSSDREWAAVAVALPEEARRLRLRDRAVDRFRDSAFAIERSVEANRSIWTRAVEARAVACS
jgi:glycosyltransferase involved in cell wall biosynthesis